MLREYTDNQKKAIQTDGRDICVAAGAGSGKTGVLVERFVRLIVQSRGGVLPSAQRAGVEEILVITFTEKATKEMKTRIVEELMRRGLTEERRQVETAYISTIHGFCSRLLQENPFEVGIDPHFTVLEEPQAKRLLRQIVENVVAQAYETGDDEITELVAAIQNLKQKGEEGEDPIGLLGASVESVLAKLRGAGRRLEEVEEHWREGVEATAASAEEIVWSLLGPILTEIQACLDSLKVTRAHLIGTARTLCESLLTQADSLCTGAALRETLSALRETHQVLRKTRPRITGASTAEMELAQSLGRLKIACDSGAFLIEGTLPESEQVVIACHRMWKFTVEVWKAYDEAKRQRGKLDNDDLQAECVRLLEDFPEVQQRYQRQLRYLMIDEFQDTNPLQMRLVELLHVEGIANNSQAIPPNHLFVVGDVQQSIYGFRNAEPALFRDLERRYREGKHGLHVGLSVNFRSRPEILRLISTLFRQIWRDSDTPFVPLEAGAVFESRPAPCIEALVTQDLMRQDYMGLEPEALARRIQQMVEGEELRIPNRQDPRRSEPVRYRDVAVLLRQLTDIQKYEEAFARIGVPYFVVGGGRGYYARQEIRDILNILTVLDTPLNDVALMAALRSPIVGADIDTLYHIVQTAHGREEEHAATVRENVSGAPDKGGERQSQEKARSDKKTVPLYIAMQRLLDAGTLPKEEAEKLIHFVEVMDSLRALEDRMPVGHLLERLIARTQYDARLVCRPNGRRRLANVRKLLQMANSDSVLGVREFIRRLRDLEKLSDREGDAPTEEEAADVVRFHTIHGAKGLEFPVVILADLCRSLDHPERGLFVCDPHHLALGSRICGDPDLAYRTIDHRRQDADREEAERLLYVAMTRAREHLILCGNLGRNRGLNWGDRLFTALGILESPSEPVNQTLIGGLEARIAPLSHYVHTSIVGGHTPQPTSSRREFTHFTERLVTALLNGDPIEAIAFS